MSYGKIAEAYVEVKADTTKFKQDLTRKVKTDLDTAAKASQTFSATFAASMATASASLKSFGAQSALMGRNLMRSVTLPLAGIGVAGVKMAADFESSLSKITALVGVAAEDVKAWEGSVKELAVTYGKSANDAAQALFFITSAGLRGAEALDTLEASLKASAVGLGDVSTIADLATSAVNAYGSSVITASKATDVLAAAVREGKLEAGELAGVMGSVLPFSSQLGVQFDEVGATFAALSRTGTNAATAATQLRGIFASLIKPSAQANKQLEAMGLSAQGLRQQLREQGLLATLETLTEAFGTNEEAAGLVFGNVRALAGVMDLMGANVETTRDIFNSMATSTDDVNKAFEVMQQTASFKLAQAFAEVKLAIQELGESLMPIVTNISGFVAMIARGVAGLDGTTKTLLVTLGSAAAIMGPLLFVLGKLATMLGSLVGAVGKFVTAIATLNGATTAMTTKTALMTTALGGVTAVLSIGVLAWLSYKSAKDKVKETSQSLINVLKAEKDAQTELSLQLIGSNGAYKNLQDLLVDFGLTLDDVNDFVFAGTGAFAQLAETHEVNGLQLGDLNSEQMIALQLLQQTRDFAVKNAEAQLIAAKAAGDFNKILQAQNDLLRINGQAHNNYNMILGLGATQFFATADAATDLGGGLGSLGSQTDKAAKEAEKLRKRIRSLKDDMRDLFDKVIEQGKEKLDQARQSFVEFSSAVAKSVSEIFNFGSAQANALSNTQLLTDALTAQTDAQKDADESAATAAQSASVLATAQGNLAQAQAEVDRIRRTGVGLLSRALQRQQEAEAEVARELRKATEDADALSRAQQRLADATKAVTDAQQKPMTFFEQLTEQANKTSEFGDLVQQLIGRGLSEQALQQVLDAGVEAGSSIAQELLSGADNTLIEEANRLTASIQNVATITGDLAAQRFRSEGVRAGEALVAGITQAVSVFQLKLSSKGLTPKQIKKLQKDFAVEVNFDMKTGRLPEMADGAIVTSRQRAIVGERGPEAIIPITRPARALELLEASGLAALARSNASGAAVSIQNATFTQPTDVDLLAQKINAAAIARSL